MRIIAFLLVMFISPIVHSADWEKIDGIYAITSESYLDPSVNETEDSHYRIQLKGKSAKDLYEAIKTKAVIDECTGGLAKNAGEMQCLYFKESSGYECHFSINIIKQSIEYGVAC